MGGRRAAYRGLDGKTGGMKPLRRPRSRRENNIKVDRRRLELEVADCADLAEDREEWPALVNTETNVHLP